MTLRPMLLALAVPAVLAAGEAAFGAKARKVCINRREINTLRALDEAHVYAKAGASKHYLITMEDRCQGLDEARKLEVLEASSRVCGEGTSLLAFEHPAAGPMRCRIAKIELVRDLADAEERIAPETPRK